MPLETAPALDELVRAQIAGIISAHAIGIVFGVALLYLAYASLSRLPDETHREPNSLALKLNLQGSYPTSHGMESYIAQNVPAGFSLMFAAGTLSGLLGIGSGAVKVLAMDRAMRLPFKVSTTTSNFMIGVTAAASAGIYLSRGYISPGLAMPVMLGVLAGSMVGSRLLVKARVKTLRIVFAGVIVLLGMEMIYNSISGRL